jgi:heptosyltransferase-2
MQLLTPLNSEVSSEISKLEKEGKFYQTTNHLLSKTPKGFKLDLSEKILSDQFSFFSLKKKLEIPDKNEKWICIFPGSVWETKKWSLDHYRSLVGLLLTKNYKVFLMGAPGEEKLCDFIFNQYQKNQNIYNYAGLTTVYESALLMAHCDLVVGNDSASSHLATVCDKKLITFFGPTVLSFGYRPWGDKVYVFQNEELKCRPCGPHGHHKCPIGTHECMKSLKPMEVFEFIQTVV